MDVQIEKKGKAPVQGNIISQLPSQFVHLGAGHKPPPVVKEVHRPFWLDA